MKKQITLEQLKEDGIAQLKTKRQLVNQGIIELSDSAVMPFIFKNVQHDPRTNNDMPKDFGKSLKITGIINNKFVVLDHRWAWPIEAIAK